MEDARKVVGGEQNRRPLIGQGKYERNRPEIRRRVGQGGRFGDGNDERRFPFKWHQAS